VFYRSGKAVSRLDVVAGVVDVGSFPAEPFVGQIAEIVLGGTPAEVFFLVRPSDQLSIWRRQSRVAAAYISATVPIDKLRLRYRASRLLTKNAGPA
jgi:hypothetical protein